MRFRRVSLDVPMPMWERLSSVLTEVKKLGLLPEAVEERDFLLATVFMNGLAMVEADLQQRRRRDTLVVSPGEVIASGATPATPSPTPMGAGRRLIVP